MAKPDLKNLSTELSYRVCKHVLGKDNEQCKLLFQKAKNNEIPLNEYTDEMQKLIEQAEQPTQPEVVDAEQGRPEETGGAEPNQAV